MIPAHRVGAARITVVDSAGAPRPDRDVEISLRTGAFRFGNIGFDFVRMHGGEAPDGAEAVQAFGGIEALEDPADFSRRWLRLFNQATLPFYWGRYEPRRGITDAARLRTTAQWLVRNGVEIKGHPLVWHTSQPQWLLTLGEREVEDELRQHVRQTVASFAGLIDHWDAINETVIMPVFENGENAITPLAAARGRTAMVRLAVEEARAGNPQVRLVINDFGLSERYERVIEDVLEAGITVDAIGLQMHMHKGYRGDDVILETLERFSRFGLPLQMTENTLLSGDPVPAHIQDLNDYVVDDWPSTPAGEARQAEEIDRLYRLLFGQPSVDSITYWGMTDRGSWLGAPCGLLRTDGTPKPAYDVLDRLINQEWGYPTTTARTDGAGRLQLTGPLGTYRLSSPGSQEQHDKTHATVPRRGVSEVELSADTTAATIVLSDP